MKASSVAISILLSSLAAPCSAFVTPHRTRTTIHTTRTITTTATNSASTTSLQAVDIDIDSMQQIITSTSNIIADAATAVAAEVQVKDAGWWETYLNFYKTSLLFVHSTITSSLSTDQTWGISIATFTAREYYSLFVDSLFIICRFFHLWIHSFDILFHLIFSFMSHWK